jgi:hypothetical protein
VCVCVCVCVEKESSVITRPAKATQKNLALVAQVQHTDPTDQVLYGEKCAGKAWVI